jgi:hypothetical protein
MADDISARSGSASDSVMPLPTREPAVAAAALEAARERTIRVLTDRFADDTLSLDEFETRLDRMYKATSPAELDALLREVEARQPRAVAIDVPGAYAATTPRRILAVMSSTKRTGRWALPRRLQTRAIMSELVLDLREVALPTGVCEIDVFVMMANLEILVPPGVVVEEMPLGVMANVENDAVDDGTIRADAPRIRLVGTAIMSNVEVRVAEAGLPPSEAWRRAKWSGRHALLRGQ